MFTLRSESSPRQIRALLVLLVLVPLIPTVLMLRFMVETVRQEQQAARDRLSELYARSFDAMVGSFRARTLEKKEAPAEIVEFCRRQLSADVAVQLVDEHDRELAGESVPSADPVQEHLLGEKYPGWKLRLYLRTPAIRGATEEQVRIYQWTAVGAIAVNLLIAGLASVALHWRIRLNQLENSALATLAHELKTPVASMKVLLETLSHQRDPSPAQMRDYVALMGEENDRLGRLLEQFLALTQLERAKGALHLENAAPGDLAEAAVRTVGGRLREDGCDFAVETAPSLPSVTVDRGRVTAALVNLLDNAWKYTAGEKKRVRLRVHAAPGAVDFEVADNGIGIAPGEQRKIFERFYQADQKLSRAREGCGLGLSIVRETARAHGGSITVQSAPGRGSTFRLRLPAADFRTANGRE